MFLIYCIYSYHQSVSPIFGPLPFISDRLSLSGAPRFEKGHMELARYRDLLLAMNGTCDIPAPGISQTRAAALACLHELVY